MATEEVDKVREFVSNGGTLIATGLTSLMCPDGTTTGNFALSDVFGVSYAGGLSRRINYLVLPGDYNYISCDRPAPFVRLTGAEMLAELGEPLFDPDDPWHYASIHSNPPGRLSGYVGLSVNTYGKGRCIYLAPSVLALQQDAQQTFGAWMLHEHTPARLITRTTAPAVVEITVLRSTTADTFFVGLVNYQKELPNLPVYGIEIDLSLSDRVPKACVSTSSGKALPFKFADGIIQFKVPSLETFELAEVILAD